MKPTRYNNGPLNELGVVDIAEGVARKVFSAQEVVQACLERIRLREPHLGAWVYHDGAEALRQAAGVAAGSRLPLAGVPFGAKDVFDSAGMPTEMGSRLYSGHRPRFDAASVARLRGAGAVLIGKTATAEFAGTQPTDTRNPRDPDRTPGGSSSGSAAAVADCMVPFALGTQTGGSVLRPAAFCGIVGFKPTFGFYPVAGMKPAARSFDTVGVLARSIADVARIHAALMSAVPATPREGAPRLGVFRSHLWDTVETGMRDAMQDALARLERCGAVLSEVAPPPGFETITEQRAIVNAYERAGDLTAEWLKDGACMSRQSRDVCTRGQAISGEDYVAAREAVAAFAAATEGMFADIDVLVTPTAPGPALEGHDHTGDPRLQEIWTMLHLPSLSLPLSMGGADLPVGLQMVGRRFRDRDLLGAALWAAERL